MYPAGLGKTTALVGRSGTFLDSSSSSTVQPESWCGHAVQGGHCSRRVEITPPNSKVDLESLWRSGDQPFCIGRERPLSALLLTDSCYPERGCAVEPLAQRSEICIPPSQNNAASAATNQRGEGCCASGKAEMAQPTIVSRVGEGCLPGWNYEICMCGNTVWRESVHRLTACIAHDNRS